MATLTANTAMKKSKVGAILRKNKKNWVGPLECSLSYRHVIDDLPEGEGHATTDDHLINLIQHVLYQLDLVCYL